MISTYFASQENADKNAVAIFAMQDDAVSVSARVSDDSQMEVLAVTRSGRAQLFKHQPNGRSAKPLKPALSVLVGTNRGAKDVQQIQILTAKLTEDSKLLLAYGSYLNITFERVTPDFTDKIQHLLRAESKKLKEKNEIAVSKLKPTNVDGDVEYLVTGTPTTAVKRSRTSSNAGSQLPMEIRLENLSLKTAANTPGETPTKATNMAQLLMQGLHSKDKAILRDVLLIQDETMVKNTVARLPVETIAPLLKELTAMLQGKTQS